MQKLSLGTPPSVAGRGGDCQGATKEREAEGHCASCWAIWKEHFPPFEAVQEFPVPGEMAGQGKGPETKAPVSTGGSGAPGLFLGRGGGRRV